MEKHITNKELYKLLNAMVDFYPLAKMRYRYVDYKDGVWTIPISLEHHRIDKVMSDYSVEKIQIKRDSNEGWETFDPFDYGAA